MFDGAMTVMSVAPAILAMAPTHVVETTTFGASAAAASAASVVVVVDSSSESPQAPASRAPTTRTAPNATLLVELRYMLLVSLQGVGTDGDHARHHHQDGSRR